MKIYPQFKARLENQNQLIIENETDFYKYVSSLNCGDLSISVEPFKNKRSLQQNRYYFALLNIVRDYNGHSIEDLHSDFKRMFLPKDRLNKFTGELYASNESTTKLNTIEFSNYIEEVRKFCAENLELVLPDANDF